MEQSSDSIPFFSAFGEFKHGYNREEAEAGMNEGFRARQRQRQERYMMELLLGSGLGEVAEKTVHKGLYVPQAALHCSESLEAPEESLKMKENVEHATDAGVPSPSGTFPESSTACVMNGFRKVEVGVQTLRDVVHHLDYNLDVANKFIERGCSPFAFDSLLEFLSTALTVIEEGDAHVLVMPPIQYEGVPLLKGAEAVMGFVRERITPLALTLVSTLYATEWMLRYTMAFIDSLLAQSEEEANLRLELLARCVRWLGKIDRFIAFAFALELKWEVYGSFTALRELSEQHIGDLLDSVEDDIAAILLLSFPKRRKRLLLMEKSIMERVRRAVAFLNEIENNWVPNVKFQAEWRDEFLTRMLQRIHLVIAPSFLSASLGFIDESLYKILSLNELTTFSSGDRMPFTGSFCRSMMPQEMPKVLMARRVEIGRVKEKINFQYIGVTVKGMASSVIGLQLCMGARYILQQCSSDYDEQWGFSMSERADEHDLVHRAEEAVSRLADMMRQRLQEKMDLQAERLRTFFRT